MVSEERCPIPGVINKRRREGLEEKGVKYPVY
jgi:hypothetical protein